MSQPYFVRPLTGKEKKDLLQILKHPPDARVYQRAQAVLLSSEGQKCQAIAAVVRRDATTVYRWLVRFSEEGIVGLTPRRSPGRPPKANAEVQEAMTEAVRQNPRDLGYIFTRWTTSLLTEHLRRTTRVELHPETVRTVLKRLGYRYGCPKLDLRHRQDSKEVTRAKRQRTRGLKKRPPATVAGPSCTSTKPSSI
jgi:transposase